ncbi:Fur family transcriptional regulator [Desulfolutivibrio sulfoxidireducens]|uniref:Fur family transcriptional regulator n=1 Tax=Desulfolutivibrio sulfoxidireducens TaxID=2773299 RepID=UPI00159D1532|nr:transcriptional repressor [Desulfolutivibrio sulfoxidireducens]QLA17045.1 transcriptional repressor [Desulfolutivibrio sulfoxidireducens]QLA20613.1 transcriptional repressor [Desulfolutivibrio sulfoxidireducens]
MTDAAAERLLRAAGIEATPIRRAVLAAMSGEGRAVSALDILSIVRRAGPVNKVTVYRTLDLFVEKGVALRHAIEGRSLRYCLGASHGSAFHCHVWCRRCGRMECMPEAVRELGVAAFVDRLDMDVEGVEIRIDGLCRQCRRAGEGDAPPRP